jgi:hypothetical protein
VPVVGPEHQCAHRIRHAAAAHARPHRDLPRRLAAQLRLHQDRQILDAPEPIERRLECRKTLLLDTGSSRST